MITNFEIVENYALSYKGTHIDLHNNFDFVGLNHDITNKILTLSWVKTDGDWVHKKEFNTIELVHEGVSFLLISSETGISIEDKTLNRLGYFPSNERHINDSITHQNKPQKDDDIIYLFENDEFIRVNCLKTKVLCS
jgi:hypothetical protein